MQQKNDPFFEPGKKNFHFAWNPHEIAEKEQRKKRRYSSKYPEILRYNIRFYTFQYFFTLKNYTFQLNYANIFYTFQ